jgi:hypothetical protein
MNRVLTLYRVLGIYASKRAEKKNHGAAILIARRS